MITYDNFMQHLVDVKEIPSDEWSAISIGKVTLFGEEKQRTVVYGKEKRTEFSHIKMFSSEEDALVWISEYSAELAKIANTYSIGARCD